MVAITNQTAIAITNATLFSEVQRLAITDDLTQLANRRGFLELGRHALKRSQRMQTCLAVLFTDLDGLKNINDRLGHAAGAQALIDLAIILKATFRESDIIARLGGDEFVVLIEDSSPADIELLITRLHAKLEALNSQTARTYRLALSIGVAYTDPAQPGSLDDLLIQADGRMYADKRGRQAARS